MSRCTLFVILVLIYDIYHNCLLNFDKKRMRRTGGRSASKITAAVYRVESPALTGQTVSDPAAQGGGVASRYLFIIFSLNETFWTSKFDSEPTGNKTV
jgi:hypothetical protein